ncbi:hypothetical protein SODALDRAFT_329776 [Sodiomyces alkalinus F11]|uniref:Geranylgeranyl pyrophosphate synthetase n=1 Tax=Sodiomyces alkalinus (strain CBS 110278 / VKM F-3762 / F11) TaxID=1314773 RepID=A0A3N2PJ24_SODAK|nr:hypothetical protein SODALDRAFT_329776 [Sodiomyces alkalinus F11]ROT34525.1 hypothetical protein SODALDRAFT_329776 [Sodiomyces alkalinus F11]
MVEYPRRLGFVSGLLSPHRHKRGASHQVSDQSSSNSSSPTPRPLPDNLPNNSFLSLGRKEGKKEMASRWSGQTNKWERHRRVKDESTLSLPPPLGPECNSIAVTEVLSADARWKTDDARITNCKLVATYSWLDRSNPWIIVPGAPARWAPPRQVVKLKQDAGTYYRDKNASRHPDHPWEPTVEAVMRMNCIEGEKVGPIDLVACGSTLGNLLRFVRGEGRQFRMLVEVVGSTVHLIRRENSPKEIIPDVHGYGHSFPEAYTEWDGDVRGSASHQRILRYEFAGLGCLVRFEGDGYLPEKSESILKKKQDQDGAKGEERSTASLETISDKLATAHVASVTPQTDANSNSLQVSFRGRVVPQEAMFDLKTRSIKRDPEQVVAEELPRLWLAQIPNFILARHQFGFFNDIQIKDVREEVRAWESANADALLRFARLLHRIVDVARDREDGKMEILGEEDQPRLKILEQLPDVRSALPGKVALRWESWLCETAAHRDSESDETDSTDSISEWVDLANDGDFTYCSDECGYCGQCNRI